MVCVGNKLSMLFKQGKHTLDTKVVMSNAKEDEVDDGSPAWDEEENNDRQPTSNP